MLILSYGVLVQRFVDFRVDFGKIELKILLISRSKLNGTTTFGVGSEHHGSSFSPSFFFASLRLTKSAHVIFKWLFSICLARIEASWRVGRIIGLRQVYFVDFVETRRQLIQILHEIFGWGSFSFAVRTARLRPIFHEKRPKFLQLQTLLDKDFLVFQTHLFQNFNFTCHTFTYGQVRHILFTLLIFEVSNEGLNFWRLKNVRLSCCRRSFLFPSTVLLTSVFLYRFLSLTVILCQNFCNVSFREKSSLLKSIEGGRIVGDGMIRAHNLSLNIVYLQFEFKVANFVVSSPKGFFLLRRLRDGFFFRLSLEVLIQTAVRDRLRKWFDKRFDFVSFRVYISELLLVILGRLVKMIPLSFVDQVYIFFGELTFLLSIKFFDNLEFLLDPASLKFVHFVDIFAVQDSTRLLFSQLRQKVQIFLLFFVSVGDVGAFRKSHLRFHRLRVLPLTLRLEWRQRRQIQFSLHGFFLRVSVSFL